MSIILRVGAVKSSRANEVHYGSGDEASSYTDADVLDIPLPEHTYQRPHPPPSTHAHSNTGYFGLPYQDHNYGMPPPPSPSRPVSPRPSSPLQVNGVVQMEEEVKTTPFESNVEEVVEDSVTRCICGYLHDDGYMICCDRCSVWQHIDCVGVDRNNIPESYFCELCQPRILDAMKAKLLQKRKREELAARNVLSDSSATDTDPEEAANALASMGKKLPICKKKNLKHKRSPKVKDKQTSLKLKIGKGLSHKKVKKSVKKEKENIKTPKPRKIFKSGSQKLKAGKNKNHPLLTLEQLSGDPWNSNLSPWVDSYEFANDNQYSPAVRELSSNSHLIGQTVDISTIISEQLLAQVTCVAEVKKNRKGLRATQEIPAGQAIIEYKGRVVLRHDYDKEHAFVNSFKKLQPFVLFYSRLDVDLCVDARAYGNEARFVRRSCSPNSEVQHILSQGKVYFVLVSKKDILAGSEITIPFDYNYENCSYYVECACTKSNCRVSKYWKKLKNAQKSSVADVGMKRKRQPSVREVSTLSLDDRLDSSSSQRSPTKGSLSPIKTLPMKLSPAEPNTHPSLSSPVKLSNVCTLLAASALLDEQPDLVTSLQLDIPEPIPQAPPSAALPLLPLPPLVVQQPPITTPLTPLPLKSATSSRRGSRVSEELIKEEKPVVAPIVQVKEKHKTKEPKPKEKEIKEVFYQHHQTEIKKERRPSLRRHSQDDVEEAVEVKVEAGTPTAGELDEAHSTDCPRKLTREERKLDAIMKAFEKMEKREERRKEAMARGDTAPKKCPGDIKVKKKHEGEGSSNCGGSCTLNNYSTSQDGPSDGGDTIKTEPASDNHQEIMSPAAGGEVKSEIISTVSSESGNSNHAVNSLLPTVASPTLLDIPVTFKEESPQKPSRKMGKRKRRKSRVQSSTVVSDAASVSTDEGNSNSSFPIIPLPMPTTPASLTPVSTPVPLVDMDSGLYKHLKTKKHLFEEWASRHEDENCKHEEEIFVQYLPNPHVNTMDHLQRRHSHSVSCSSKNTESSAGSAKKRWLRQAMHEVPAPVAFNHSLSVSTESGGGSPVHGGASPNPGTCLGSPGASSPLDFVTPLKKRRLMRESISSESNNGPIASANPRVLADSFGANITPKTNGMKQFFPSHRHSTDDRLLLHKNYPHQNGFREVVTLADERTTDSTHFYLINSTTSNSQDVSELELRPSVPEPVVNLTPVQPIDSLPRSFPNVPRISEAAPISSISLTQTASPYKNIRFRGIFERMEVDSSDETFKGNEVQPIASSSRIEDGVCLTGPSLHEFEDDSRIDSSASTTAVVTVNSNLYAGVNNLMDEGSEAGYVTAKTIVNVDSPATVRVDLNAHEMQPSLSGGRSVVTFDDRLFNRSNRGLRKFEIPSDCQVNSSEDVGEALPLITTDHINGFCDNVCMDSTSTLVGSRVADNEEINIHGERSEEERELVDSSQHVNSQSVAISAAYDEVSIENNLASQNHPGTSASLKTYAECISSSEQTNSNMIEASTDRPKVVCDSVEESSESVLELADTNRQCDTGAGEVRQPDYNDNSVDEEGVQTCDSVGGSSSMLLLSMHRTAIEDDLENVGDSGVSESRCSDEQQQQFFINSGDSNVDSTSSETNRNISCAPMCESSVNRNIPECETVAADADCCDSNFERLPNATIAYDSSVTGDESSMEGLNVSSSNVLDLQSNNSWECYPNEIFPVETSRDHAVSTVSHDFNSQVSESTLTTERCIVPAPAIEQPDNSTEEAGQSSATAALGSNTAYTASNLFLSSNISCSFQSSSSQPLYLSLSSSSSSSAASSESNYSSMFPSPPGQPSVTGSGITTSRIASLSPPILSTAEATPAIKKKVSLLEYRKRLKDKPVVSSASETKASSSSSSVAAAASSSSSSSLTSHHHKLSPTLTMYLASSPSSSASSISPSKSPSSSSTATKKHRMPTLVTLPLFKDADTKKEEDKKKEKVKPDKHLSLTERLRLEFGLEDCGDANKNRKDDGKKHRSPASSTSPPPPPPPLLPPSTTSSPYHHHHHTANRHSVKDGEESEVVSSNGSADDQAPPPPPPPHPASGFNAPSAHPRAGFIGSQVPLVNGGSGAYYNYLLPQTGILSSQPSPLGNGGRDRQMSRFSGSGGATGPCVSHSSVVTPYQSHLQQQPSSASHLNPPPSHLQSWAVNQTTGASSSVAAPTNIHHHHPPPPPPPQFDYNHWQPSQTVISESTVSEDHPPPPPPPPPRPHQQVSSSSSSSSSSPQHRHHHHHNSSAKSKSSKAAALSSSSSSHYVDNRSRH